MPKNDESLVRAFHEDHRRLGEGFYRLSACLRANDPAGARRVAQRLNQDAGAHIAFEEDHFYPALVPLLGEAEVSRMYAEHRKGLEVVRDLIDLAPDAVLPDDHRRALLEDSESMERHIAECGELFKAMGRIPAAKQAELLNHLRVLRREQPAWRRYAERADAAKPAR